MTLIRRGAVIRLHLRPRQPLIQPENPEYMGLFFPNWIFRDVLFASASRFGPRASSDW